MVESDWRWLWGFPHAGDLLFCALCVVRASGRLIALIWEGAGELLGISALKIDVLKHMLELQCCFTAPLISFPGGRRWAYPRCSISCTSLAARSGFRGKCLILNSALVPVTGRN